MKRFRFRLARLESLRDVRRREARAALATTIAELRRKTESREAAERALASSEQVFVEPELAESSRALREFAAWRAGLFEATTDARRAETAAAVAAVDSQSRYAEAARAHRVIERLREQRLVRWRHDAELEDRKFLDETHLLRLVRQRAPEDEEEMRCEPLPVGS